jgi:glyoxylase-like metal-dependent hydrolase (beta-lactamase superfamily II)
MVEIMKGIHKIDNVNANSYFLINEDGSLVLVDSGMQKSGKKILDYLTSNLSKQPSDIKTIILTHCHVDHVRGAYALKKATGARIAAHKIEADYITGNKTPPAPKGLAGFLFKLFSPFFSSKSVEVDQSLEDGNMIGKLLVLHTPGHTPGSIALYEKEKRVVFVGDTISYDKGRLKGPPKAFSVDMKEVTRSMEKISKLDFRVMLPGHGETFESENAPQRVKELSSL